MGFRSVGKVTCNVSGASAFGSEESRTVGTSKGWWWKTTGISVWQHFNSMCMTFQRVRNVGRVTVWRHWQVVKSEFIKNFVSKSRTLLIFVTTTLLATTFSPTIPHQPCSPSFATMDSTSQPIPRQIGTRASNKLAHPGQITKSSVPRRTSTEVQQEREAKAKAKADREEAKQKSIKRTADFERADLANEDLVDATPRPPFTPKPWPPPRNKKKSKLTPVAEAVDNTDLDDTPLTPVPADDSVTEDESDAKLEDDSSSTEDESEIGYATPPSQKKKTAPPAKKQKIAVTKKATRTASEKVAEREKKVDRDEKVVASDETPKPKKVKAKVREEIDLAAKKMEDEGKGDKYAGMIMPVSNKPSSQLQAVRGGGKKLKREGAIADINALYYKKVTLAHANALANPDNDLMDIDNR
jgi:hypothetical protein